MKVFVVLALCLTVAACQDGPGSGGSSKSGIANRKDSLSYFFGTTIGNSMRRDSFDMNTDLVAAGIRDALKGDTTVLGDSGYMRLVQSFSEEMRTKQMAQQEKAMKDKMMKDSLAGITNKQKGDAFLAENKAKSDVITLPSGLQYRVIKEGTGAIPGPTDQVQVLYRGSLIGEQVAFDSSGVTPVTLGVNQVVPGWTEALQKMKVGSKWQLFLPPALGYGEQSPGEAIGPNAVLIFDIELVGIAPPQAAPENIQMPGGNPHGGQ